MCYDIKTSLEKQLRRALLEGSKKDAQEIAEKLNIFSKKDIELHHASGFEHPQMYIYTQDNPFTPTLATWGLVPEWSIDKESIWNKTLNARGETIFEKASFKDSAIDKRCLIYLEGFYEHHHKAGKAFPYFIQMKDKDLFAVAGLWSEWINELGEALKTFSIVTTRANALMASIHNNPKLAEPRMPLILEEKEQQLWLNKELNQNAVANLMKPLEEGFLIAHTVAPIRGSQITSNLPNATDEYKYSVLESGEQLGLF
jgi:putative SOS response-associated peptidase YedK